MSMWSIPTLIPQLFSLLASAITGEAPTLAPIIGPEPKTTDGGTAEDAIRARNQLALLTGGTIAIIGAPAIYAASLKLRKGRKKRIMTEKDIMFGRSLENASTQATGLLMTGLAAPAIAAVTAYILVQKLEDAKVITKGLGNATQGLLTVAAAGPAIQGIGQIAGSAFKAAK